MLTSPTILIVDDERIVRRVLADLLAQAGFQTITAASGEAAIVHYAQEAATISVVILDYAMPGMTGEQVFYELRKINPLVKVIISSGYIDAEAESRLKQHSNVEFLPKPYLVDTLLQIVNKLLD